MGLESTENMPPSYFFLKILVFFTINKIVGGVKFPCGCTKPDCGTIINTKRFLDFYMEILWDKKINSNISYLIFMPFS